MSSAREAAEVREGRGLAACAYWGVLVLLPLFSENRFARYHARQGVVLLVAGLVFASLLSVPALALLLLGSVGRLPGTLDTAVPVTGWLCLGTAGLLPLVLAIVGTVHALAGKAAPLPLLGRFTALIGDTEPWTEDDPTSCPRCGKLRGTDGLFCGRCGYRWA